MMPIDGVLWVGVTDQPFDKGEMGFGSKLDGPRGLAKDARKLAGLEAEADGEGEDTGAADGADPKSGTKDSTPAPAEGENGKSEASTEANEPSAGEEPQKS